MKVSTICVAAIAAISAAAPVTAAQQQYRHPSQAQSTTQAEPSTPAEALRTQERVRVIVELVDPNAGRRLAPDAPAALQAITDLQAAVLRTHFAEAAALREAGDSVYGLRRMTTVPAFAINVNAAELARLEADPRVRSVGLDRVLRPSLIQSNKIIAQPAVLGAPYNAKGQKASVAVFDTGVDNNHKFLNITRIIHQACFSGGGNAANSFCPNGGTTQIGGSSGDACTDTSFCAHGTHVAGIVAGANTNTFSGEPNRGVAPQAKIIAVEVFSKDAGAYSSDLIAAMNHIFTNRAGFARYPAAVNMSLAGGQSTGNCDAVAGVGPFKTAIDQLRGARIAVVVSSGNNGFDEAQSFPACISTATSVGASTKRASGQPERVAIYSNIDATTDLLAPGGDLSSNYPTGVPFTPGILSSVPFPGTNSFLPFQGTSMAAPHVAGAFALIRSAPGCGTKSVPVIEKALKATGLAIQDIVHTKKRINVRKTLDRLGCN